MIAWTDSVIPAWVRVEDVSDTDHPTAVKLILPTASITARNRSLAVPYNGQPSGVEIVCNDADDAAQIIRSLANQFDTIRWARRREAHAERLVRGLCETEADRRVCDELAQLPTHNPGDITP